MLLEFKKKTKLIHGVIGTEVKGHVQTGLVNAGFEEPSKVRVSVLSRMLLLMKCPMYVDKPAQ